MSSTHGHKKNSAGSSARGRRPLQREQLTKRGNPEPLTQKLRAELDTLAKMPEAQIDTTEMPPTADWSKGVRGAFYRPVKRPLSLRIDADVVDWFQGQGEGYQTKMNAVLREYVSRQRKRA